MRSFNDLWIWWTTNMFGYVVTMLLLFIGVLYAFPPFVYWIFKFFGPWYKHWGFG